ncbi:MAG: peroxidase [Planctomycetales bacterium 12-60-4]|nr:MAG: peroxidase [Planctomycetales bacterium 12-60-4]
MQQQDRRRVFAARFAKKNVQFADAHCSKSRFCHRRIFSGSLTKGALTAKNREQIALAVSQTNGCEYCLAAHSTIGKMVGLNADQIRDSRLATAVDSKTSALLQFARNVVDTRGHVADEDLQGLREFGFSDGEIAEVVANVALSLFTNYFNHVANTDVDFPVAEKIEDHHEACATIPGCDPTR